MGPATPGCERPAHSESFHAYDNHGLDPRQEVLLRPATERVARSPTMRPMPPGSIRQHVARSIRSGGQRLRPGAHARTPAQRSVLDDIVLTRPWNILVKALRLRARLRQSELEPGVTVIVVNWNTVEITSDVLRAVQRLSPAGTRVLLIDNGSTDGSRVRFEHWPGLDTVLLPSNAGHGAALDIGVLSVQTTVAVTLDSDAVPLRAGWLEPAVGPLLSGDALLAGVRSTRNFVHPVYLAIDTATFVRRRLSFQLHKTRRAPGEPEDWGRNAWDTAELLIAHFEPTEVRFVEGSPNTVPGLRGGSVSDVVYHHGGVTLNNQDGVPDEVLTEWRDACRALGMAEIIGFGGPG